MNKRKWLIIIAAAVVLLSLWLFWGNRALTVNEITVVDPELPEAFRGFRIAQVSDLHGTEFGRGNRELLGLLSQLRPDIIVFTGDTLDYRQTNIEAVLEFVRAAAELAPCYFATGNHEAASAVYPQMEEELYRAGVTVLRSRGVVLEHDGESLRIVGADDYGFYGPGDGETRVKAMLAALEPELEPGYNIVLYHRPELAGRLREMDADLILSGHAHGGQVRLPFIGGLYAPDQGLFPVYDGGLYDLGDQFLVVSRGLGNSLFPLRVNNPPEIVLITLEKSE